MLRTRHSRLSVVVSLALLTAAAALAPDGSPVAAAQPRQASSPPVQQSGDPAGDTTRATVDLSAGFIMDPYLLPVIGAGDTAADQLLEGCNGFVRSEPNVVVNWSGETEQLNFFVYSDSDPALVVELPDGTFLCNDDAGLRTVDPLVTIEDPAEGAYRIHVGSAASDQPALGFLGITAAALDGSRLADLDLSPMLTRRQRPRPQPLPRIDRSTLLTSRPAIFGAADLEAGFEPVNRFAAGGGNVAAFQVVDGELACAGFISPVPSYRFNWSGDPEAIRLFFEGHKDSALVVLAPDGQVYCNIDAASDNLNPALDIAEPAAGQYDVFIAGNEPSSVVLGRLTITGDTTAAPAVLQPAAQ